MCAYCKLCVHPVFTDWWMDDYISHLYGSMRTMQSTHFPVLHHTATHGRRYDVGEDNSKKVPVLVAEGRQKIAAWMRENGMPETEIMAFVEDSSGLPYKDFPCGPFTAIPC